jgi:hypothetical protein
MSKRSIARKDGKYKIAQLYGNLFLLGDGLVSGWINIHIEGYKPVKVKVIDMAANAPIAGDATFATATLKIENGEEDNYRYLSADIQTMGDAVAAEADAAGISAAALKRNGKRQPIQPPGLLAALLGSKN